MIANITGVLMSGAAGPAQPPVQKIYWPLGADGSVVITVTDESGNPVSLAGRTLFLGVAPDDVSPRTFVRQGVNTNESSGICTFTIAAADTAALSGATMRFDVWDQDSNGNVPLTKPGDFVLMDAIVRNGDVPSNPAPIPPIVYGAVDTVNTTGATLAAVDASTLTDGIPMWVRDSGGGVGSYWHIEIGKGYPIDSSHIAALNLANGQWVKGLGIASSTGGDGYRQGAALTDANATIAPGTDHASEYVLSATLTANRTITLSPTSANANATVRIQRKASTGAFTLTVVNGGTNGGTIAVFAVSPTENQAVDAVFNGVDWLYAGFAYLS